MIVVDTSVWIAFFNRVQSEVVNKLKAITDPADIIVGDIILLEVLHGARDERHALRLERELRDFDVFPMLDPLIAGRAAANYRKLRSLAWTVRATADLIIATYCIAEGHVLLHDDRDFVPFERHLGLRCL